eukprot:672828-Rhodomonas_salina.1
MSLALLQLIRAHLNQPKRPLDEFGVEFKSEGSQNTLTEGHDMLSSFCRLRRVPDGRNANFKGVGTPTAKRGSC